jgi:hypothetical protein
MLDAILQRDFVIPIAPSVSIEHGALHLSSTLRILCGEGEGLAEPVPEIDGNFHAVWIVPGH